jgi:hypothetical protein
MKNSYLKKYLKYKNKYLNLKQNIDEYIGGNDPSYNNITNKETALRAVHNGYVNQIPIHLIDYEVAYAMTEKHNIGALKYFDHHKLPYIDDDNIVMLAITKDPHALAFASPRLQDNIDTVLPAVILDYSAIKYASDRLLNDPETFIIAAMSIRNSGKKDQVLKYASYRLQRDFNFVLNMVQINGLELDYALPEFKDNYQIVLAASRQNNNALRYASSRFKNNSDLILAQANAIR